MDLLFSILPIAVLIYVMTKRRSWPSHVALPFSAVLVYFTLLIHFESDPGILHATVLNGALSALTPISIIWGAVLFSATLKRSGAEDVLSRWLNGISPNPVAQLMIIGWAFSFMIEGASGFGTPAAIAAPILVGLGFEPIRVALLALVMNSVPVSFGAVGTPTWFGFAQLDLSQQEILAIGWKSVIVHAAASWLIPLIALRFLVTWKEIKSNIVFIYLSVFSCVLPYGLLATVNYEFPALLGGAVGFAASIFAANKGWGLKKPPPVPVPSVEPIPRTTLLKALVPLATLILILVVTRIPRLPFKALLNSESPALELSLGSLGELRVSAALVIELEGIFGTASNWEYNALYVPAIIPFVLVVLICIPVFRLSGATLRGLFSESTRRMKHPALALVGALIMVQLMMVGGDNSKTMIIGSAFARATGEAWQFFAPLLGALGSFFSGSATVSNLTFSGIQASIATQVGLDKTLILAQQSVGAAMGNMVCINNIVAVCSILGVFGREGYVLKRTVLPMVVYAVVAALASLALA